MTARAWLAERIEPGDRQRWEGLGFRGDALRAVPRLAAAVLADEDAAVHVRSLAHKLQARIGSYGPTGESIFGSVADESCVADVGSGQVTVPGGLAIMALLATTDDVRAHHASRGIDDDQSWRTLSDLGQQVWVHSLTYENFGLHTHTWLETAWSGALQWVGRLQFNLQWYEPGDEAVPGGVSRWVLSTHIPQSGPMTPEVVQDSLDRARALFAERYADHPFTEFHCTSWLLDPTLARLPGTNLADFQARWSLTGEGGDGDADALFFVFHRRGEVDRADLPRETGLQRLVLDRSVGGEHWRVLTGLIPLRS
ncbi:MAG: acyltransferase domain-containing protein [Propionibacteriales bacterium]|nr:acyltransferase domain-containing protein [Propionibacteriales bacterium]